MYVRTVDSPTGDVRTVDSRSCRGRPARAGRPTAGLDQRVEPLPAEETPQLDPGAFRDEWLGLLGAVR